MIRKVAFLGLGVMGYPMAGHLNSAGFKVTVYNRTKSKAEHWQSVHSGDIASTPAEAARGADLVLACVGEDRDVREICHGDTGILAVMKEGSVFVDHTTASASLAEEIDVACRAKNLHFIDAPVSGGQQGAENANLTVMCGGEPSVFERIQPVLMSYASTAKLIGPAGSGQLCKMVNQICIAGIVQGLAEGLHFAQRAGLEAERVIEVISRGAAQSWQMENRYKTMLADEYDHGFAVDWMRKDLGIVLAAARSNGAQLPLTALVDQFYSDIQAQGGGRWDTSSLLSRLVRSNLAVDDETK
jgi:3-hydroxyisobutyrate dehydrogenase-like beta-hydroxyacid dehydrogenase